LNIEKLPKLDLEKCSKTELKTMVHSLVDMVNTLIDQAAELKAHKNSSNSSTPPSHDFGRVNKNQSLRKKSGLKPGGQINHKGSTLKMSKTPHVIVDLSPCFCGECGSSLDLIPNVLKQKRQVIDIPEIKPVYTEHRSYSKTCGCGHENQGDFPSNIKAPVQYGESVESLASYLSVRQYMPYQRMEECFNDVFGISVSSGTLVSMIRRMSIKALPAYNEIKRNIQNSQVVGSDETGAKINGDKGWFWVWQNKLNTYITVAKSRGYKVIESEFPDGLPNSILQSDCLPAQLKTKAKGYQICIAHLLREIEYFMQLYDDPWSKKLRELFHDSLELKNEIKDYDGDNPIRLEIVKRLDHLLDSSTENQKEKIKPFHKRLKKYRYFILTFLFHEEVFPDNNASERAIRNLKVKLKISGQFITLRSAMDFAVLRSIIDTCVKNGTGILNALKLTALVHPE
jgi:transposase